ncbi:MAG TPA: cation:proton antiporter [Lacipirellulaceae bacterium]|jgi:CPA2 family monovalent cation:H+ antiporter-2|nr:cation:proton antiporter [Lacipirellulaceae bacterium]
MHDAHEFLQTLAMVLCVAAVTTVVFQWLKQPVVLGYLLAGMIVGPHVTVPLEADSHIVHTLAELGVILLMFSLGLEFSLSKLFRVGVTAGFVAIVQCSLMVWLGYLLGVAFGWPRLESLYGGAIIAISSTTIIVKAFEEQGVRGSFTHIVFGILIVEDLIAILLITILTALSAGEDLGARELAVTAGQLAAFLGLLIVVGLLVVPRLMRAVAKLDRPETTLVASIGLAFGFALLAAEFGYSVALGAFLAGSLVAESGVEKTVEHLVQPVRDIFAAIFFVSVGMLIDPSQIAAHWFVVLIFLIAVIVGKIVSVGLGAFLTGQSVQNSARIGMSVAQIGEFSFIIAGVGVASKAIDPLLYSMAIAVSAITTLLTPWLIRAAPSMAAWVDRTLPRPLQTFAALYSSWIEQLSARRGGETAPVRRAIRWLVIDVAVAATILIVASIEMERLTTWATNRWQTSASNIQLAVIAGAAVLSAPFWIGAIRVGHNLVFELAGKVFPVTDSKQLDLAAAPRRLFVVTLQLAIATAIGIPLVAITQPFLPPWAVGTAVLLAFLFLAVAFWRSATNMQGHTRASAQALADTLRRHMEAGRTVRNQESASTADQLATGFGSPTTLVIRDGNPHVGKTLAELNIRAQTGATILAIQRAGNSVVIPSGHDQLEAGDTLTIAGTHAAIVAAKELLAAD